MKPGEEKCSICNHILNRQKDGCTCVGCYCPTCNDAGTGEGLVPKEMYDTALEDLEDACTERDALRSQLEEYEAANDTLIKQCNEYMQSAETAERDLATAQAQVVAIQKHRDDWREYAYGKREKPQDYVDGNKIDRGLTALETAHARIARLEKSLGTMIAEVKHGKYVPGSLKRAEQALAEPQSGEK